MFIAVKIMAVASNRFAELPPEEIQRLLDNATAKSTVKATKFGMKIFYGEFCYALLQRFMKTSRMTQTKCFVSEWQASPGGAKFSKPIEEMSKEELNVCLRSFYTSARKQDGSYYKATSLKSIRSAIDRHLRAPPHNKPFSVIADAAFTEANKVLGAFVKDLKLSGKIEATIHKKAMTREHVQKLFDSGQLGPADSKNPSQLQRTAWFYVGLYFGRRGRERQRFLKRDMLVHRMRDEGVEYFELHRKMTPSLPSTTSADADDEVESDTKIFAVPGSERCPVNTLKNYLAHLNPTSDVLFQRPKDSHSARFNPKDTVWYSPSPIGKTFLSCFLKEMSKRAGIVPHLTNHCLRATSVAVLSHGNLHSLAPTAESSTFEVEQRKSSLLSSFVTAGQAPQHCYTTPSREADQRVIGTMVEIQQEHQPSGEIVFQVRKFPVLLKDNQSVAVANVPAESNLAQSVKTTPILPKPV